MCSGLVRGWDAERMEGMRNARHLCGAFPFSMALDVCIAKAKRGGWVWVQSPQLCEGLLAANVWCFQIHNLTERGTQVPDVRGCWLPLPLL